MRTIEIKKHYIGGGYHVVVKYKHDIPVTIAELLPDSPNDDLLHLRLRPIDILSCTRNMPEADPSWLIKTIQEALEEYIGIFTGGACK